MITDEVAQRKRGPTEEELREMTERDNLILKLGIIFQADDHYIEKQLDAIRRERALGLQRFL